MATTAPKTTKVPKTFDPKFISDLDHRHGVAKEIRRRFETLVADTGAESQQKEMLCRRAVFMGVCLETMEHEALSTGQFESISVHTQMTNSLLGVLKALGLDRQVKNAHDLKSYIKDKAK